MLREVEDIDLKKWDNFVEKSGGTIFSTSTYLNTVAQKWKVWLEKDYSFGIALPYTEKLGVKTLYQPFFSRYQELLGNKEKFTSTVVGIIQNEFNRSLVSFKEDLNVITKTESFVYQEIDTETRSLSTQAKRSLKKYVKSDYTLKENVNYEILTNLVSSELAKKIDFYKSSDAELLNRLVIQLNKANMLFNLAIYSGEVLKGGIFYMTFGNRVIYLKGACEKDLMVNGGMYHLLNHLIEETQERNYTFDFGGSRIEGVRSFNHKLGGHDCKYYAYHWDNSPIWFKLAQNIRKWIKR